MQFNVKTTEKFKQSKIQFDLFGKTWRAIFQSYVTPKTWTCGQSSRCMDGRHVLFFDYDQLDQNEIEDEIDFLQKHFLLGDAFLFKTHENGYHVIIPDKFTLKSAYYIIRNTNTDISFINSVKYFRGRAWILRIEEKGTRPKPEFVKIIQSKHNNREKSNAHLIFLKRYYGVTSQNYQNKDTYTTLPIINYNTGNVKSNG